MLDDYDIQDLLDTSAFRRACAVAPLPPGRPGPASLTAQHANVDYTHGLGGSPCNGTQACELALHRAQAERAPATATAMRRGPSKAGGAPPPASWKERPTGIFFEETAAAETSSKKEPVARQGRAQQILKNPAATAGPNGGGDMWGRAQAPASRSQPFKR